MNWPRRWASKGKIAILAGNQNAPNLRNRVKGCAKRRSQVTRASRSWIRSTTPRRRRMPPPRSLRVHERVSATSRASAMIGGWPLFTQTLLTDLDPKKVKIVSVDALAGRAGVRRERARARAARAADVPLGLRVGEDASSTRSTRSRTCRRSSRWIWCACRRKTWGRGPVSSKRGASPTFHPCT